MQQENPVEAWTTKLKWHKSGMERLWFFYMESYIFPCQKGSGTFWIIVEKKMLSYLFVLSSEIIFTESVYSKNMYFRGAGRAGRLVIAGSNPSSPGQSWAACGSVLGRETEPQLAPDVLLAPCMTASAISEGPAMSWRLVQGVPCPLGVSSVAVWIPNIQAKTSFES